MSEYKLAILENEGEGSVLDLGNFREKLSKIEIHKLVTVHGQPLHGAWLGSDRWDYSQLALTVSEYTDITVKPQNTVADLFKMAQSALDGEVFTGYKGGDYTMDEENVLYLAYHGNFGRRILSDIVEHEDSIDIQTVHRELN